MSPNSNRLKSIAPVENSEHLTGFSIDVVDKKDPGTFDLNGSYKSKAWEWIEKNCSKYGFEISFPKDNKQGLNYEPWHLRYIGPEVPAELQLVFAYAKSGGNTDEATLDKICKEAPKTESIEHTQESNSSRTDLDLEKILKSYGLTALTVITGEGALNSQEAKNSFKVASVVKLHIAEVLYQHILSTSVPLSTGIEATGNVLAEGEPEYLPGKSFDIRFLLNRMLQVSSNTATNILVQYLGGVGNPINSKINKLGYSSTKFNTYFSIPGNSGSNPNVSSSFEMAKGMFQLLKQSLTTKDETGGIITDALSKAEVPEGMRGIKFNKIGYNTGVNANVAVYENSNGYFIISAINNTETRDYDLTQIAAATNKIIEAINAASEAIDSLEIKGIQF